MRKSRFTESQIVSILQETEAGRKIEEVYLKAHEDMRSAKHSLDAYPRFYNSERRHQSLNDEIPDTAYNHPVARLAA